MKSVKIEFWRFIFAIYMVIYHTVFHIYGVRTGGYIGVDVFFIISGYFLAVSQNRYELQSDESRGYLQACGFRYLLNRYKRLWPMYLVAYIISAIIDACVHFKSALEGLERVYHSFPEMFMLRITTSVNGVSWFVAAMLIAGTILYILLCLDRYDILKSSVLPLLSLFIYGRFNQVLGRIHAHNSQTVFPLPYDGIWRAFAGLGLGIFAFYIVRKVTQYDLNDRTKTIFSVLGNLGFLSVVAISFKKYNGFSDFICVFIIFIALIALMLSECPKKQQYSLYNRLICYLGTLSYPIYLMHEAVFGVFKKYKLVSSPVWGCIAVIAVTCIEAALFTYLLKKVQPLFLQSIKRIFGASGKTKKLNY